MLLADVEIEAVVSLERELCERRKRIGVGIRRMREDRGWSLRDVAPKVRLSPAALLDIERGESWRTKTVARVLRYYERTAPPVAQTATA